MLKMKTFFLFFFILQLSEALEIIPLKPEMEYINPKYLKAFKISIQRHGRGTPYYIKVSGEMLTGLGNNMTITVQLYENLSGNYVPIITNMVFKFCDFLNNEPILGQMWMKQLPKNMTSCPFSPGYYVIDDIIIHLENIPYRIPFTFSAIDVRTRCDILVNHTDTRELILYTKVHLRMIQKPLFKE